MKKLLLIVTLSLFSLPQAANAAINVFACEPEWAALAKDIGGDNVSVFSATTGRQDPHHIAAKPSLLAAIRKADMLVCSGAGLEAGWLPLLMQGAKSRVQAGQPGHFLASQYLNLLGRPAVLDRAMGDIHPEGNPHVQTDPRNITIVAKALADRLASVDPANRPAYEANLSAFNSEWLPSIARWHNSAAALKGVAVVTYHENWPYLLKWLGMKQVATLEVKPGIPPTASHLDTVLQAAQASNVKLILISPFDDDQAAEWLANKTGARIVRLPFTVGGLPGADDLKSLFDKTIELLK